MALRIRGLQERGEQVSAAEGLEVLTHALLDLASKPGSNTAELWERFDRERPKPHRFS